MKEEHSDDFHLKILQDVASKVESDEQVNAYIDLAKDIFEFVPLFLKKMVDDKRFKECWHSKDDH